MILGIFKILFWKFGILKVSFLFKSVFYFDKLNEITIKFRLTRKLCEILQLNPWEKSSKALYWRVREVLKKGRIQEYQPSGARGHSLTARNAAPPATPHRLQNVFNVGFSIVLNIGFNIGFNIAKSKMAARGPQNGRWGLERGLTQGYWPFQAAFAK